MTRSDRAEDVWPQLRNPAAERVWRGVLAPIATELQNNCEMLAKSVIVDIRDDEPGLLDDQAYDEIARSTSDSLRQLGQMMEFGQDPATLDLPASTRALVRSVAWRAAPLDDHAHLYRLCQEHVWRWLFARIAERTTKDDQLVPATMLATDWLHMFVDHALVRADRIYESERETWSRGATADRAAAIEDILGDRERDRRVASQRLRYEIARHHIGVIAWFDPDQARTAPLSVLSDAVANAAAAVGAEESITHASGTASIAGWLSSRLPFADEAIAASDRAPLAWRLPRGVRVAVGDPGYDLRGFRSTHGQAQHAARVAMLLHPDSISFTRYREVALAALCTTDSVHAVAFARQVLGPLGDDDKDMLRLAETVTVYLREHLSRPRTAEALGVHPNTVSYRIQQAAQLLGRDLERDTLDLQVALTLLPALHRIEQGRTAQP